LLSQQRTYRLAPARPQGARADTYIGCLPAIRERVLRWWPIGGWEQQEGSVTRKYSKSSGRKVKRAMHEMKRGSLRSGRSGRKVKSRKQAIAIGLSEARRSGAKVPKKK
jgi:Family of unknown function (DUF6496)